MGNEREKPGISSSAVLRMSAKNRLRDLIPHKTKPYPSKPLSSKIPSVQSPENFDQHLERLPAVPVAEFDETSVNKQDLQAFRSMYAYT